jgi:hypothetical protein
MLSKKYFLGGGRNSSAPPARPTHAEVRDQIDVEHVAAARLQPVFPKQRTRSCPLLS